jgi:hypothetical protein
MMRRNSLLGTYSCATDNHLSFSIQCWSHIKTTEQISDTSRSFHFAPLFMPYSVQVTHPRCAQISRCIFAVCRHAQLPWKSKCVVHDGILNKYSFPCRLGTNSVCPVPKKYFKDSVGSRSIQSTIFTDRSSVGE